MSLINRIRTYLLEAEIDPPFGFSQWYYRKRNALLVEVETRDGVSGWGECYGPSAVTQSAIESVYAPLLLGWDPLRNEAAWQRCWRASLDFARKGVMMGAISGLDMALFDLKGKLLNAPASELMGGRLRDSAPCYATGMYFREEPEDALLERILEEAASYVESGYEFLKIKVGKNLAFDRRQVAEMRKAFPEIRLAADANHAFDLPEAIELGRALDDYGFHWFEEPLSPQHPERFGQLADKIDTRIAAGECEQTRWGFEDLLSAGGVHIAQPDLAYCGGPSEALKIRAIASAKGINVIPHAWGTMFNLAAALHLVASTYVDPGRLESTSPVLETDRTPNPLRDELFSRSLEIAKGEVAVPEGSGWGVELDREAMKAFCLKTTEAR